MTLRELLSSIKLKTELKFLSASYTRRNIRITSRSKNEYIILQVAHRLEKGLTFSSQRTMWGYKKAEDLAYLIVQEMKSPEKSSFAIQSAIGVLHAFTEVKKKESSEQEQNALNKLLVIIKRNGISFENCMNWHGGTMHIQRSDIELKNYQDPSRLFNTRHSVRDFAETSVDMDKLRRAVDLANTCPSACNRQPYRLYLIDGNKRAELGEDNIYNANKYLIFTGVISAFSKDELYDWIVSTSIFAGYMSLTLHAEGIANCIIRVDLLGRGFYYKELRKYCDIPDDEQVILEMAIGNYKNDFNIAISNKKKSDDIIKVIY